MSSDWIHLLCSSAKQIIYASPPITQNHKWGAGISEVLHNVNAIALKITLTLQPPRASTLPQTCLEELGRRD